MPLLLSWGRRVVRRREGEELDDNLLSKQSNMEVVVGCFHASGVGVLKRVHEKIDAEVYKILIHQAMPELKKLIQTETKQVAWCFNRIMLHSKNRQTIFRE